MSELTAPASESIPESDAQMTIPVGPSGPDGAPLQRVRLKSKTQGSEFAGMTPREEVEMRKQLKKKLEMEQLTFKPHVSPAPHHRVSIESLPGSQFDRLYEDAAKRRNSTQMLATSCDKSAVVTPTKTATAEGTARLYSATGAGRPAPTTHKDSPTPVGVTKKPTDAQAVATSVSDVAADESATPSTSARPRSNSVGRAGKRLFAEAEKIKERLEQKKSALLKSEASECTFSPNIGLKATKRQKPRCSSAQRRRAAEANTTPSTSETDGHPVSPAPEEAAQAAAERKATAKKQKDITERMARYVEERQKKLDEAKKALDDKEMSSLTFRPERSTKKFPTPEKMRGMDLLKRLTSVSTTAAPAHEDPENTFQPKLFKRKSVDPGAPKDGEEKSISVHERLYKSSEIIKRDLEELAVSILELFAALLSCLVCAFFMLNRELSKKKSVRNAHLLPK